MRPLVTITIDQYNELLALKATKTKREQDLELALYWGLRVIRSYPEVEGEYVKLLKETAKMQVSRFGTRVQIETL